MFDLLADEFPDLMVQCIPTEALSSSIRPMPRPADLMEGRE